MSHCVESVRLFGNDKASHNILEWLEAFLPERPEDVMDELVGPAADLLRIVFLVCKVPVDNFTHYVADLVLNGLETPVSMVLKSSIESVQLDFSKLGVPN
jgi:hypothetical protein